MRTALIAEYKPYSPFDGSLSEEPLKAFIDRAHRLGADMLSIIVDPKWHGRYEDLRAARHLTRLPILAKGRRVSPERAVLAGADAALVYGRPHTVIPSYVECHTELETTEALRNGARTIVANNRDLNTGKLDMTVAVRLSLFIPDNVRFVAASGYRSRYQAPGRADAVLIGAAIQGRQ